MLVNHGQAERLLNEYPDGVPGYEKLTYELGKPDEFGHATLEAKNDAHASIEAFAAAAGIMAASPVQSSPTCLSLPQIIGLPNVGQYVYADAGVWDDGDSDAVLRAVESVQRPSTWIAWLYDGNEQDPVVIPEGSQQGRREMLVPAAALGRTIQLRVTRGRTTVYSQDFGPVEGGLTEFTFPAQPVPDSSVVSAEPASRRGDGSSAPVKRRRGKETPTTGTKSVELRRTDPKDSSKPGKRPSESERTKLVERAAAETAPPPAADRIGV